MGYKKKKFHRVSSITWIFFCNGIFICLFVYFKFVQLKLVFLLLCLGLLLFSSRSFNYCIWKITKERKWKHNLFYGNPLCGIFTMHNWNTQTHSIIIYLNSNCTCRLRCLTTISSNRKMILFYLPLYLLCFNWIQFPLTICFLMTS
jgi:hypothetical protein